ncbi:hypothetical protein P6144_19040 [Sphingomonas sp. HITSZ_GF]|uniref:hypothetical protein n=1 Tax=Sphingomonas sp. HITSZ_GF TaxID=3037247 RepID=UPI00240D1AD4|nr:hypothetical protein [Sphingomonas sp. HITSZ_GF]MDG2535765.1 hypothetical protein [Sphingomonas sp. HITSZ_GF]
MAETEIIAHRRNLIDQLRETPTDQGIEVDIRSQGDRLVIHHDPFAEGGDFEAWLAHYRHGTLILNVKEEGLEARLLALMAARGIERFFFLDQSFPFLVRAARAGERRCAVRVSEYESVETALAIAPMIDWVWVDIFTPALPRAEDLRALKAAGLKLCLVSPELQGRPPAEEAAQLRAHAAAAGIAFDAVCTKEPALWR